jgi:hypothetical protein
LTTDKFNCSTRCSLFSRRRTVLRELLVDLRPGRTRQMQTQRETVRKKYEEQSRAVQLKQRKPEVRSEVCNLCSVVTETLECYHCSELRSVIVTVRLKVL